MCLYLLGNMTWSVGHYFQDTSGWSNIAYGLFQTLGLVSMTSADLDPNTCLRSHMHLVLLVVLIWLASSLLMVIAQTWLYVFTMFPFLYLVARLSPILQMRKGKQFCVSYFHILF
jgi:hypothetical protein